MSDPALQYAQIAREALATEINALNQKLEQARARLAEVDAFIRAWHDFAKKGERTDNIHPVEIASSPDSEPRPPARKRPKNPPRDLVGDRVEEILRGWGQPANRKEIYNELRNVGVHIQGSDPEMVLSTMLWRMRDRFIRLKGFGYWIASEPFAPASYDPAARDMQDLLG